MQKIQAQRGQERIEDSHCTTDQYLIKHVLLVYDELIPSFDVRKSLHIGLCIMQVDRPTPTNQCEMQCGL